MNVSVIIPALNEAPVIAAAIEHTRALSPAEVIVVDGGSSDGTADFARQADRVIVAPRGRSHQQNAGAAASTGEVLLFLHADCRLAADGLQQIESALADARCAGGCFRQRIDAAGARYRLLERGNALRVRLLRLAYGDQGIFVRRPVFERLGGFPAVPIMEDLFFMKRLRREGRIALLAGPLTVSARRWQYRGVVRQTARNWYLTALAHLGVAPHRLARFYPDVR